MRGHSAAPGESQRMKPCSGGPAPRPPPPNSGAPLGTGAQLGKRPPDHCAPLPLTPGTQPPSWKEVLLGTSLAVQWISLPASPAGGTGSIPCLGTKDPACHVAAARKKEVLLLTEHNCVRAVCKLLTCHLGSHSSCVGAVSPSRRGELPEEPGLGQAGLEDQGPAPGPGLGVCRLGDQHSV